MAVTKQLQWSTDVIVDAPLEKTWAAIDNLSLIPHRRQGDKRRDH